MTTETNRKAVGMKNHTKYSIGYFMPPEASIEWVKKDHADKAPIWCSVDLRDGNQALVVPMSLDEKLEFCYAISVLRRSKWDSPLRPKPSMSFSAN